MLTREKAGILLSSQFYVVVDAHPKSECWLLRTAIIAKTYFLLQSASSHVYKELGWWTASGQAGQCREGSLEGTSKCSLQVWRFRRHSTWSDVQDRDRPLRVLTLSRKRREARSKQQLSVSETKRQSVSNPICWWGRENYLWTESCLGGLEFEYLHQCAFFKTKEKN